jgi:hypothetical protein
MHRTVNFKDDKNWIHTYKLMLCTVIPFLDKLLGLLMNNTQDESSD